MAFDIEKLRQIAKPLPKERKEEMENRIRNNGWLKKSAHIALAVKRELRHLGMTQQEQHEANETFENTINALLND